MTGRFGARARWWAVWVVILAGCSAPVRKPSVPVFFPPPPAPPRIQFLTAFSGLKDIESQSAFDRFIVGEKENLRVDKPYGIAVADGRIYVCDTNLSVEVFDLKRKTFGRMSGASGTGALRQPLNISIDAEGIRYVADPVRGQVVAFDKNDQYLKAYGLEKAWRPVDAASFEERVYVVDAESGYIRVFDKASGNLIKSFGDRGEPSERLERPTNLVFDAEGTLHVTDVGRFQVVKFDRDGHFKGAVGRPGDNLGHFARPKGAAIDRDNRLYVVDAAFNNVQVFDRDGRLLMFFGGGGAQPGGLLLPAKVTIDYENVKYFEAYAQPGFRIDYLVLVTNQFGDRRVSVYGFGKMTGQRYPTDEELRKEIEERSRKETEK